MTTRSEVPTWAHSKLTDKQRSFILSLVDERQLSQEAEDRLMKQLRISEDPEEIGIPKQKASEIIEWLLKQPKKKSSENAPVIPAGRYAVENNEGELRFYQVWRPKGNPDVLRLYVLHGPDSSPVHRSAWNTILEKIGADVRGAAIRFGNEIGACSNCGRRLTNRISRELGIGPICGGRMFVEDDWKSEVKAARERIKARGEDPDEELE